MRRRVLWETNFWLRLEISITRFAGKSLEHLVTKKEAVFPFFQIITDTEPLTINRLYKIDLQNEQSCPELVEGLVSDLKEGIKLSFKEFSDRTL